MCELKWSGSPPVLLFCCFSAPLCVHNVAARTRSQRDRPRGLPRRGHFHRKMITAPRSAGGFQTCDLRLETLGALRRRAPRPSSQNSPTHRQAVTMSYGCPPTNVGLPRDDPSEWCKYAPSATTKSVPGRRGGKHRQTPTPSAPQGHQRAVLTTRARPKFREKHFVSRGPPGGTVCGFASID